jgi:hypothetical protein
VSFGSTMATDPLDRMARTISVGIASAADVPAEG